MTWVSTPLVGPDRARVKTWKEIKLLQPETSRGALASSNGRRRCIPQLPVKARLGDMEMKLELDLTHILDHAMQTRTLPEINVSRVVQPARMPLDELNAVASLI